MMKKTPPPADPDAYVLNLRGWKRRTVEAMRDAVLGAGSLEEQIKWGHLVYFANGPVLLIRAEEERVLFGFWRGQRLGKIEPRLKPGGKYEMATMEFHKESSITSTTVRRLTREAVRLNKRLGDPTLAARKPRTPVTPR